MKTQYSIRLYRSWRFYLLRVLILCISLLSLIWNFYILARMGFTEMFFPYKNAVIPQETLEQMQSIYGDLFLGQQNNNMAFVEGVIAVVAYILSQIEYLAVSVLAAIALFGNRLYVREDDTRIYFAPRLFFRVAKRDICKIEPIAVEELGFWDRLSSCNFSRKYLYYFTCYDTVLILSSKDEAGMAKLTADIQSRHNLTEEEEFGEEAKRFTWWELLFLLWLCSQIYFTVTSFIQGW